MKRSSPVYSQLTRQSARSSQLTRRACAVVAIAATGALSLGSLAATATSATAAAQAKTTYTLSGDIGTHDPSRLVKDGNTYYSYSTGGNVPMKYSTDKIHWKNGQSVFPNGIPAAIKNAVKNFAGNVWAPDVIYANGQYRLYYAVWGDNANSAIALVTSPTLNPSAANYKWTSQGIVVSTTNGSNAQAIDPAPYVDASGNYWLSWGSGYPYKWTQPEIFQTRLDNKTGLKLTGTEAQTVGVLKGHEEGSYVQYHNGYYYLFWNTGSCCNGTSSTYTIHVARSTSPAGTYTERSSKFFSSTGNIHGPGHIGILTENGTDYYTYHYYNSGGSAVLGLGTITWGSDGWPNH
jgi:arabinan endo-1,5-alpha-L-arabinosidase